MKTDLGALVILLVASSLLASCKGGDVVSPAASAHEEEAEGHGGHEDDEDDEGDEGHAGHGGHGGHGHEAEVGDWRVARCEHGILQAECDECRYELGLVRVPEETGSQLLETGTAAAAAEGFSSLNLRCESQVDQQRSTGVTALVTGRVVEIRARLGQVVAPGDVLAVLDSEEFGELKLQHLQTHQRQDLAEARLARLEGVQKDLRSLLDGLSRLEVDNPPDLDSLLTLETGQVKADLLAAGNGYQRALADWQRDSRLVEDARLLVLAVEGKSDADIDSLHVGEWKARILEARADLRAARQAHQRISKLVSQGVVSRREEEQARRDLDSAKARFDAALEQVELDAARVETRIRESLGNARARLKAQVEEVLLGLDIRKMEKVQELEQSRIAAAVTHRKLSLLGFSEAEFESLLTGGSTEFGRLEIRAPSAGAVISQNLALGLMAGSGEALFTVADLTDLWVWCDVYDGDLPLLQGLELPLTAQVFSDAWPQRGFEGTLDYLDLVTDAHSRTVKARIVTDNREKLLRPGMFLTARILIPGGSGGVLIPRSALVSDEGESFVFVPAGDLLWLRRDVEVIGFTGQNVVVGKGLAAGDQVVTRGAFYLKSDVLREKMGAGCAD